MHARIPNPHIKYQRVPAGPSSRAAAAYRWSKDHRSRSYILASLRALPLD